MRHVDLTKIDGTIGKVFADNRDQLINEPKSVDDVRKTVSDLFVANNINTPKSRQIEFKLKTMSFNQSLMYVQNIIFAAGNMNI